MVGKMHTRGMWQVAYKATDVLCSDGKRRTARITGQPDTVFTIPASVSVKGKTVTGFVTGFDGPAPEYARDLEFCAVLTGKNHALLPGYASDMVKGGDAR